MLASLSHGDAATLFWLLAFVAFAGAVYAAVVLHNYVGAVVAAFIGILILLFGA